MRDEKEFLKLMQYPKEWVEWDMLPKVIIIKQTLTERNNAKN